MKARYWAAGLTGSIALHLALVAMFAPDRDAVEIAGGAPGEVAVLGNAFEDAQAAGAEDVEAVDVVEADVETLDAATVEPLAAEPADAADPVRPETADAQPATSSEAVAAETAQQVDPDTVAVTLPQEAEEAADVEATEAVEPTAAEPSRVSAIEPEDGIESPEPVEAPETVEPERAEPATAESVTTDTLEPIAPDAVDAPVETETQEAVAQTLAPVPRTRPEGLSGPGRQELARQAPAPAPAAEPEPQAQPAPAAGSGGQQRADSRRGEQTGAATGSTASANSGSGSQAGNAAVSNYPGQVVSRLRRALFYPPGAGRVTGEAVVSFTVAASGQVAGVRLVQGTGNAALDQAAIETVRRAAPFPPIPAGAGRNDWTFTLPLAFRR